MARGDAALDELLLAKENASRFMGTGRWDRDWTERDPLADILNAVEEEDDELRRILGDNVRPTPAGA